MKKFSEIVKATAIACMVTISISGCTNSKAQSENQSVNTETIIVTDAKGEVEIPANPQKIVDISGNSDILSLLGYSVIGTANSDAYDYTKVPTYLEDVLKDATILGYSMQDTMDVEGIIALEPDLIIMSSVQEKMYTQLSAVAPTIMIELAQIDWKEDVKAIASIMNKTEEATQWLNDYMTKANESGDSIKKSNGEDATYFSFLASGGQIYVFDKAGIGSILYDDLGLARPSGMPQQENISLPVLTYEGLASINADYIIAVGTDADLAKLEESNIWKSIPAVQNGNVVKLPSSPYFNEGYSSIGRLKFLDEILGFMEKINE